MTLKESGVCQGKAGKENGSAGCGEAISGGSYDDVFLFSY